MLRSFKRYSQLKGYRWPIVVSCSILFTTMLYLASLQKDTHLTTTNSDVGSNSYYAKINEGLYSKLQVQEPAITLEDAEKLSKTHDIAVTHPPLQWTDQDLAFFKTAAGETVFSQLTRIPEMEETPNFSTMTSAERLYKALFMYFDKVLAQDPSVDVATDLRYKDSWTFYKRLEGTLYPWLYDGWENAFQINNRTSGRGIVIAVGDDQFRFAATTIRTIRQVLKCKLPIEIFFVNEEDLSVARRSYLQSEFKDLTLRKVEDYVGHYYTQFGGWAMKPFCILASSFREVLMMDADAFFLQNPAKLFDDKGYQLTGSLFFYDRTLFPDWNLGPDWLSSFLPTMSTLVPKSRWFQRTSSHEQESGVIVMDKQKALLGLLSTCKLNGKTERDEVVYERVHGDKETFWVGFEIMQTPYAFNKFHGAVIGRMGRGGDDGSPENVCGNQLHVDINHVPLWFNGGLYRQKYDYDTPDYLEFTHFAEGEDWDFDTHCLNDHDKIQEVDPELRAVAMASIEIDKKREKDEILIKKGKWVPKSHNP